MENYDFKEIEESILEFWKKHDIYQKAKTLNKGNRHFYWLEGPPYTSGEIHIGHAWNKALKDAILRHRRMAGFDVWDRSGYDMHGLPTELKVEKKLGIKSKEEIPSYGIAKFVEECRKFAVENMNKMTQDFIRLGVWMDFENAYQPIKNEYMEGEWWLIKKAEDNQRLYEGEKVMHWCSHCATALAKHELEYKNVKDDSIFLKFKVKDKDEYLIIWTTTPWTIPFNLGIMANPELDYVKAEVEGEKWILAKALASVFIQGLLDKKFKIIETFKGKQLEGLAYEHPFSELIDYKKLDSQKIHTVVMSTEYVDTTAGSGLVHMATGCGPEDQEVGKRNGIPAFNNLDEYGVFPKEMGKFSGLIAKKDDKKFVEELKERGALLAITKVEHDYAHCWRCKNPVIYRTTKQWFFKVEDLKERMRKLNQKILWVPEWAGSKQFDSWLENLKDNCITRQRYWGTPVPIWKCDKCSNYDVFGSIKELAKRAKVPADIHKPYIDEVEYSCVCGGKKKRIPDILDVWIDSGTASWNCLDYPREEHYFKKLFPPDFILEGNDQIRGWFNLLFVASIIGMNSIAYKAVYMHGIVNDALGRKMSKSLGNYISPYESIDTYGADAFRLFVSENNAGMDLNYNMEDIKTKQKNLMVLWNLGNYLIDLSKQNGLKKNLKLDIEEKYIISKLNSTIKKATEHFNKYEIDNVPGLVEELFLELSRTYIQLTREKTVKKGDLVFSTIYEVYSNVLKMLAPICPFITEAIYQEIKKEFKLERQSIHHCKWPEYDNNKIDEKLEKEMFIAKQAIQTILATREKAKIGVRWPLRKVIIGISDKETINAVKKLEELIKVQTNIKEVSFEELKCKTDIKIDYNKLAPDFGTDAPTVIAHIATQKSSDSIINHINKEGKYSFTHNGKRFNIVKEHLIIRKELPADLVEAEFKDGNIYLDTKIDEELEAEGYSRELMRRVQALRKNAGLNKQDRINLFIKTDKDMIALLSKWNKQIAEKVGADKISLSEIPPSKIYKNINREKIKSNEFEIMFSKI